VRTRGRTRGERGPGETGIPGRYARFTQCAQIHLPSVCQTFPIAKPVNLPGHWRVLLITARDKQGEVPGLNYAQSER
jgi:hypothetical protein